MFGRKKKKQPGPEDLLGDLYPDAPRAVDAEEESASGGDIADEGEDGDEGELGEFSNDIASERELEFQAIKASIHRIVVSTIDLTQLGQWGDADLRLEIRRRAMEVLAEHSQDLLSVEEKDRLVNEVIDETFGLGPLEPLLRDPSISDILINGPQTVYIERSGKLEKTNVTFANEPHLENIIQRIVSKVGRRIDESNPMVDARLEDGSRVNAVIPPLALDGALMSIRRFGSNPLSFGELLKNNSITPEMMEFLTAAVKSRLNIIISGGTGSGKTTLLNALSAYIPSEERVATIEDAAELQLQQEHVIRMETRPMNVEGTGEVTTRDLVRNALRMRPDRIVVGECRGPETLDMLQAMNTGHDGSLTTVHANSPRDAVMRLEMMVGMAGVDIPIWTIRSQIASAVQVIVQTIRLTGGPRKVVSIAEITGMEGEVMSMHEVFKFNQTGLDSNRVAEGYYTATGVRPKCLERMESVGYPLPASMFEQRILKARR